MKIEIWSDVVCPWCYLGKRRLEQALAAFEHRDDVEIVHRAYQLDPSAPSDHTVETTAMLSSKYGMPREQAERMQREMEQRAAGDGLEYHLAGQRSGNTRDAHRLLALARARGVQDALVERLYRAYFTDGASVFDAPSLTGYAVECGLDRDEAAAVLAGDDYGDEVDADIEQARAYGVTGVPFVVVDGRFGVSGAQPVEVFATALERASGS